MNALTQWAIDNRMLVLLLTVLVLLAGPISFGTHPSREDPAITTRTAVVTATVPGMSPERIENLVTRTLEEAIRELPEVQSIKATSRTGQSIIKVELHDRYFDLEPIWQSLRNKVEETRPKLPDDTRGPFVNDNYGAVAMATIAVTADGFSHKEISETADSLKQKIYTVPGVSKVTLYGIEPERIAIEFNAAQMASLGLTQQNVLAAIARTNVVSPGGSINAEGLNFIVEPTGSFESIDELRELAIAVPERNGRVAYLQDLADIRRVYVEPVQHPVLFNGKRAVVIGIEMTDAYDADAFGRDLASRVTSLEQDLPLGYELSFITFQPGDIERAVSGVMSNLYQTITIVLIVVIGFLGFRSGLIVGAMIPLTMLLSLLIMRYVGIELERMSLASLIIALGLLVDNGIVVVEEIKRRMESGQAPASAAIGAGKTLALPLLASSLTTIFAFMPLMLAENEAGEYTRSLSLVIAIALLASWLVAMIVTPVMSFWGLRVNAPSRKEAAPTTLETHYQHALGWVMTNKALFLSAVVAALVVSGWALQFVPNVFFPSSDRTQLQVYVDLPVGSNADTTLKAAETLADFLSAESMQDDIVSSVVYVADGGPRFYLALNPIDPEPHRAFGIVNVRSLEQMQSTMSKIQVHAANAMPEARVTVKRMSMGAVESGLVEYRVSGPDPDVLKRIALELQQGLRDIDGTINIRDDWNNRVVKLMVDIDQARARRVGVTTESIATAMNASLSGLTISDYREGDDVIPIILRAEASDRSSIGRLRTLNVNAGGEQTVPLIQVASVRGEAEFAVRHRRDMAQTITVSAKSDRLSAVALDRAFTQQILNSLVLSDGYRIERGGEIEKSAEARNALFANMPLAAALILLVLVWQFKGYRKALMVLTVIPLTLSGVTLALLAMPGATMSFIGTLGLLSLAGIIINNAIVLIDKIDQERAAGKALDDAIINAATLRFRPIVMTTITTVLGLMPLIVFQDILFYDLAVVLSGGLIVGTVLTLGVVPVLYRILFGFEQPSFTSETSPA